MTDIILIITIQLVYVPMLTLRTICMVKNLKILTSVFGVIESLIYIFGLAIVLTGEQSVLEMVIYALGYGVGLAFGMFVEQKLAIGFTTLHVNINHPNNEMIEVLRQRGYGVTVFEGEGRHGKRFRLDILTKRNSEKELLKLIHDFEPNAFVISYEPTRFKGGYMMNLVNKKKKTLNNKHIDLENTNTNPILSVYEQTKNEINELAVNSKQTQ